MNKFSYGLPKDLYKGMRVRPNMDIIANMLEKDPYRIKYPDREATFYLNSPQFLSVLQDTNVGLAEQSKRLEKQKLAEAMARLNNVGGSADTVTYETASEGDENMGMMSPETLRRQNLEARARRAREERERLAKQEEDRREQERRDYEYAQFLRRQEEEARRIQTEMAQAAAAASSQHPIASSSASLLVPGMTQERLIALAKGFIESSRIPPPIDITYLTPQQRQAQQGIVPQARLPFGPFGSTAFRLSGDDMTDSVPSALQTKRRSDEITLPIAKAKLAPAIEDVGVGGIGVPEDMPKKATTPVRKTETKQEKTQELKDALSEELTTFSRDAIRSAFTKRFPKITKITGGQEKPEYLSRSNKSNIIIEWINQVAIKGNNALAEETRQLKEQRERLSRGQPASANYPPVGVGGGQ